MAGVHLVFSIMDSEILNIYFRNNREVKSPGQHQRTNKTVGQGYENKVKWNCKGRVESGREVRDEMAACEN